jgi:hypothetical protein
MTLKLFAPGSYRFIAGLELIADNSPDNSA